MAEANVSARAGAINTAYSPKIIMSFARFVATLPGLVAMERRLHGYCAQDPAIDAAITGAEQARAVTMQRLDAVLAQSRDTSSKLRTVALLFHTALSSDDPAEVARLRHLAWLHNWQGAVPHATGLDGLIFRMIRETLDGLEAYLALEEDGSGGVAHDAARHDPVDDPTLAPVA